MAESYSSGPEDIPNQPIRGISSSELRQVRQAQRRLRGDDSKSRFLHGDDLHKLRRHILSLRHELEGCRARGALGRVEELERAILFAQNLDAEFVYATAIERANNALLVGDTDVAREFRTQARHARNALPQFQLDGLWVGKYGESGFEMINVTYSGDTLIAYKVTGGEDQGVPKGEVSFVVDLSLEATSNDVLEPIELADHAASQWGSHFLQRFAGQGQVAGNQGEVQWVDGQLILVNQYFSFAWLPIGEQVFFGRPSAELTLKLLRNDRAMLTEEDAARAYLERCYNGDTSTDGLVELSDVRERPVASHDQEYYYSQEGCFE